MGATCPHCKEFNASICFNCGAYYGEVENAKASKLEKRLAKELAQSKARIEALEDETNSLRKQNVVLMDIVKTPFSLDKKPELSIFQKWEMSLLMMRDMIYELYGNKALSEEEEEDG